MRCACSGSTSRPRPRAGTRRCARRSTPALAMTVRDSAATGAGDGTRVDDARPRDSRDRARRHLTPVYRAQLFSMVAPPDPGGERAGRSRPSSRAARISATRSTPATCTATSSASAATTASARSPTTTIRALDRHWPVPGLPEKARLRRRRPAIAPDRAHAMFRVDGFVDERGSARSRGAGARRAAGSTPSVPDDIRPAIDGKLASITGKRATVYDLEAALARGFDGAARQRAAARRRRRDRGSRHRARVAGHAEDHRGRLEARRPARALTIANYFPRNQASSDMLLRARDHVHAERLLAARRCSSRSSTSDYFNRHAAPRPACGDVAVHVPGRLRSVGDRRRRSRRSRKNGPGDAVTAVDARTLVDGDERGARVGGRRRSHRGSPTTATGLRGRETCTRTRAATATSSARAASVPRGVPTAGGLLPSVEVPFERGVGMFLRNSERGFRGLDFQARLVWEDRYGACARPAWVADGLHRSSSSPPAAARSDARPSATSSPRSRIA